jgi:hypothetical protein
VSGIAHQLIGRSWRLAAAQRNRGFRTRIAADPDGPALILSPHLDDAVLDCWSVLTADREVTVANVFTAMPPAGSSFYWDRIAGASDSAAFMTQRIAEDRRALALAGRTPVNLPFHDGQYRGVRRAPYFHELDAALVERVPAAAQVLAPASLGTRHGDHLLLREYARMLGAQGLRVTWYADVPYAVEYGWPGWVTGRPADPHIDIDAYWELDLGDLGVDRAGAQIVRLGADEAAAKLVAMRTYETQFPTLDRGPIGRLALPEIHGYEVFWEART